MAIIVYCPEFTFRTGIKNALFSNNANNKYYIPRVKAEANAFPSFQIIFKRQLLLSKSQYYYKARVRCRRAGLPRKTARRSQRGTRTENLLRKSLL